MQKGVNADACHTEHDQDGNDASREPPFVLLRDGDDSGTAGGMRWLDRGWCGTPYVHTDRRDVAAGISIALQPQQLGTHLLCALITEFPVFFQCPVDDVFELRGQVGVEADWRNRGTLQNGIEDDSRAFPTEGQ